MTYMLEDLKNSIIRSSLKILNSSKTVFDEESNNLNENDKLTYAQAAPIDLAMKMLERSLYASALIYDKKTFNKIQKQAKTDFNNLIESFSYKKMMAKLDMQEKKK